MLGRWVTHLAHVTDARLRVVENAMTNQSTPEDD